MHTSSAVIVSLRRRRKHLRVYFFMDNVRGDDDASSSHLDARSRGESGMITHVANALCVQRIYCLIYPFLGSIRERERERGETAGWLAGWLTGGRGSSCSRATLPRVSYCCCWAIRRPFPFVPDPTVCREREREREEGRRVEERGEEG